MSNFKDVKNDILKDWFDFREQEYFSTLVSEEDKKHHIYFEEIYNKILNSVPKECRKYVSRQLDILNDNFMEYVDYWNEKYYMYDVCDGVQLINKCLK